MSLKKKLARALETAGLDKGLSENLIVSSETEIPSLISKLKGNGSEEEEIDFDKVLKSDEFAEYFKNKGIDEVLKNSDALQKGMDSKVGTAVNKFKKRFLKDDLDDDDLGDGTKGDEGKTDNPVLAAIKKLGERLDDIERTGKTNSTLSKAEDLFSKSETLKALPEKLKNRYLNSIDFEGETSLEDQIKGFEEEAGELNFSTEPKKTHSGLPVGGSTKVKGKADMAEAEGIVKSML